jgi:AmmeMemoRadiSam system protein A
MLDEKSKKRLLEIARKSVEAAVKKQPPPQLSETDATLMGKQGAFVTLKNGDDLRGCLGNFKSDRPLYELVAEMATASATEDPRFFGNPIRPSELPRISIEISVLSPMEKIANPLDIELGKHGIYIQRGWASGCFLPQVATETGWTKEEFLSHCCGGKAGLSADAWKRPGTDVYVFTAEVFGEERPS